MRPGFLLALCYLLVALNLRQLTGLEASNLLERGAFLFTAIYFVAYRGFHIGVLIGLAAVIGLVLFLAAATPYAKFAWSPLVLGLNQFIIVYLLLAVRYKRVDVRDMLNVAAWMPLVIFGIGALYAAAGIHPLFETNALARLSGSLIPAFYAGFAVGGIFSALKLGLETRKNHYHMLTLVNLAILLATGARMPVVITIPICLSLILLNQNISVRTKITVLALGAILSAIPVGFAGGTLLKRLEVGGSSGREEMWAYYQGIAQEYYWSGIGYMQSYYTELPHDLAVRINTTAVHNDFIRLSAELGTPGMIGFYLILSLTFLLAAWKNSGLRGLMMPLTMLLAFLVYSWSDNTFGTPPYYMLLILGVVASIPVSQRLHKDTPSLAIPSQSAMNRRGRQF